MSRGARHLPPITIDYRRHSRHHIMSIPPRILFPLAAYTTLFLITLGTISTTLFRYPLFPLQSDDLDWSVAWLVATVVDYYGSTLCFSGIVIASESTWLQAILWTAGFCLAGSPICCIWMMLRVYKTGSLRLEQQQSNGGGPLGTENQYLYSDRRNS